MSKNKKAPAKPIKAVKKNDKIAALKKQIEELKAENNVLRRRDVLHNQVINLNQDAIFVKDKHSNIIFANKAALEFYPEEYQEELIGSIPDQFFSKEQFHRFRETDEIAFREGFFSARERIVLNDGSEMIASFVKKRFLGDDNREYLMVISRDETEREDLITELRRSNQDLDNFAYVASHDLRSPLNAIKTMVSWVIEDCEKILPNESMDNLALVMNRAERMEKLLTDLLDYSRIGRDLPAPVEISLRDKVFELLNLVDLPMGFGMHCDDVTIRVPEVPFGVVLVNLLSNAIKHHDSTNATISITVKKKAKSTTVTVTDNGPGVPDEYKKKVFELFSTLKPRDEVEGSGMGLSVVKKLIEQYGGKIHIEDNQPRGSKFIILWPNEFKRRSIG